MARRYRRRSRSRGRPVAHKARWWDTTLFETTLDSSAAVGGASFQLLHTPEFDFNGGSMGQGTMSRVRRIVYDGDIIVLPLNTAFTQSVIHLVWAVVVQDFDDTDIAFDTTSAGEALSGGSDRVLQVGSVAGSVVEGASATPVAMEVRPSFAKIKLDLKVNVPLKFDQRLYLAAEWQGTILGAASQSHLYAISRVLCESL